MLALLLVVGAGYADPCDARRTGVEQAVCRLETEERSWGVNRDCAHQNGRQDREACSLLEFLRADVELNVAWQRVFESLALRRTFLKLPERQSVAVAKDLRASEVAWIEYRETFCDARTIYANTQDNEFRHKCLTAVTMARTAELNSF